MNPISFALDPVPPFRLDLTVWTLRRRPDNLVDRWDALTQTYRRVLPQGEAGDGAIEMAVTQVGSLDTPRLHVTLSGARVAAARAKEAEQAEQIEQAEQEARATLTRTLGLEVDLSAFYRFAADDEHLGPLVRRFRGVKPPRLPSVFEALANAVACQQITLTQGIRLLNRLAGRYGVAFPAVEAPLTAPDAAVHAFPRPHDLVGVDPLDVKALGFSASKGRALVELAGALAQGQMDPDALEALDDEAAVARLLPLRGVGRWTAEYVLLRGLGRTHIFPGDDVGARNNLRRWLGLAAPLDYSGVRQVLAGWQPYGGLIYFHLLLDRLAQAGYLPAEAPDTR